MDLWQFVKDVLGYFDSVAVIAFFVAAVVAWLYVWNFRNPDEWRTIHDLLADPAFIDPPGRTRLPLLTMYKALLTRVLDWLDKRLNPMEQGAPPPPPLARAGGWRLYDRCLLLAIAYPLVFLVVSWALTPGTAGMIGDLPVFSADVAPIQRWLALILFVGLFIYALLIPAVMARLLRVFESAGVGPLLSEVLAGALASAVIFTVALAGALAGVVAIAGVVAVAGVVALAVAGALAGAGVVASAVASAVAVAFAFAGAFAGAFAVASAVALASYATIIAVFLKIHELQSALSYVFIVVVISAVLIVATGLGLFRGDGRSLALFLVILPLVNAQFDFLSMTATRFFLRRGVDSGWRGQIGWGLFDLVVGIVCFLALCLTAIAVVHGLNQIAPEPLLDLAAIFREPDAHRWLFFTFLTTLLPTFLHLVLVIFSIAVTIPRRLRMFCADRLKTFHVEGKNPGAARLAHLMIALSVGFSATISVFIVEGLWTGLENIHLAGDELIAMGRGWYGTLGGAT